MAVTLKCPECGHAVQAEDEEPQTCPMCQGTMTKPKYKAKSGPTSSDVEKAKSKPKAKADDEDEKPKTKKAAARPKEEGLSLDDDDEGGGDLSRDGKAADRVGIDPGFSDRELMRQVESELKSGEVLHWAGRASAQILTKHALMLVLGGLFFGAIGSAILGFMLAKKNIPTLALIVPSIFVLVGVGIAIFGPVLTLRQARLGWYAITDQRAIVFLVYPWGRKGRATTYKPNQLQRTRIVKSFWLKGGGSVVFKTEIHVTKTTTTDRRTGRSSTSTSRREVHYGFLYVAGVNDLHTLLRDVFFGGSEEDEDDDE